MAPINECCKFNFHTTMCALHIVITKFFIRSLFLLRFSIRICPLCPISSLCIYWVEAIYTEFFFVRSVSEYGWCCIVYIYAHNKITLNVRISCTWRWYMNMCTFIEFCIFFLFLQFLLECMQRKYHHHTCLLHSFIHILYT